MRVQRRARRGRSGQGMTEYIIIVALISIAAIGVVTIFGDNVRALFGGAVDALAGETHVVPRTEQSTERHTKTKTPRDFGSDLRGSSH